MVNYNQHFMNVPIPQCSVFQLHCDHLPPRSHNPEYSSPRILSNCIPPKLLIPPNILNILPVLSPILTIVQTIGPHSHQLILTNKSHTRPEKSLISTQAILTDIVSLAHNHYFWGQKLNHNVSFWFKYLFRIIDKFNRNKKNQV